jgi:hypothetical protein
MGEMNKLDDSDERTRVIVREVMGESATKLKSLRTVSEVLEKREEDSKIVGLKKHQTQMYFWTVLIIGAVHAIWSLGIAALDLYNIMENIEGFQKHALLDAVEIVIRPKLH